MKYCCIIALIIWTNASVLAQTNDPAAVPPVATSATNNDKALIITCDGPADFFYLQKQAIYRKNVVVRDAEFKLTCEWLLAKGDTGQLTNIVATTNVVIDIFDPQRGTNHVTADRAEYVFQIIDQATNDTITLTGNPKITGPQGVQTGDPIIWNRTTGDLRLENGGGTIYYNKGVSLNPLGGNATNSPTAAGTNTVNNGK